MGVVRNGYGEEREIQTGLETHVYELGKGDVRSPAQDIGRPPHNQKPHLVILHEELVRIGPLPGEKPGGLQGAGLADMLAVFRINRGGQA